LDERELVKKILAGDQAAQTLLYKTHAPRLKPVCIHFLGPQDPDLEDVLQEVFLIAFRKLAQFEFRSGLYTWLAHICVNLCYQRIHKRRKQVASLEEDLELMTIPQVQALEAEKQEVDAKARKVAFLDKLIRTMGDKCRKVLELRDRQGESYVSICKTLKVPLGTVMSQLARCRETLRKLAQSSLREGL